MAENKPGLLKRLFSFGGDAKPERPPEATPPQAPEGEAAASPPDAVENAAPAAPDAAAKTDAAETEAAPREEAAQPAAQKRGTLTIGEARPAPAPQSEPAGQGKQTGWLGRLAAGLSRTSSALGEGVANVFTRRRLDDDAIEALEDLLIQADLGIDTATRITETLAERRYGGDVGEAEVREVMAGEIEKILDPVARPLELDLDRKPHVVLVVGVNGSGKTTTIGKLAAKLHGAGLSTLLVAGDTFRAAAIEQLKIWGERTHSPVIAREIGADAAGLAFDAFRQARDGGHDVMLMDTAGRLQNKAELMAELEKIIRVLKKQDPTAPHTVLLTLDATTGQNALNQVEIFGNVAGVDGLVMTKLDGTARGGILVAIAAKA